MVGRAELRGVGRRDRSRPPRGAALLGLALGCCLAAPLSGQPTQDVAAVRFEGNETFAADSLARAIATRETDCRSSVLFPACWLGLDFALRRSALRARELPLDRARLTIWYQRRGFLDVQVDTPRVTLRRPGQVEVVFTIDEGRPVLADTIAFEGAEPFQGTGLLEGLPLRQGDRLSTLAKDATQDTLVQRLRNRGYAHADVFFRAIKPAEAPYDAQVTFEIAPGPSTTYGAIEIGGIERLSAGTVRRTLQLSSGDAYSDADIDQARARLFGLEIVRSARVEADLSGFESVVPVSVLVQEGDAYRVRGGGGWSTDECLSLEARWASRNFLGGGRLLQVRARTGNILAPTLGDVLCNDSGTGDYAKLTWVASVDFAQPWIFSTDNSFGWSIFAERQTLPDIFVRRAIGSQIGLTRAFDVRTSGTVYYRPEVSELDADDVLFCTGFLVCRPDDIRLLEGANRLSPVGANLTRDRSDDLLNPRAGSRLTIDLEHAAGWTGSNFRYDRAVAEGTWYEALGGNAVLATRLRGGWVGSGSFEGGASTSEPVAIVHPQRRFFAGGANSVRGFAQSRLGPRVLFTESPIPLLQSTVDGGAGCTPQELVDLLCDASVAADGVLRELPTGGTRVFEANAEIRFPLGSFLEAVAFTDFGQAWGAGEGVAIDDIELTPGFGLRFPSPVGPIRLDLAFRPRGARDLAVVAPRVREFDAMNDAESQRLVVDGMAIPYVQTGELIRLDVPVLFTEGASRFQLHVSIGQAF